MHHKRRCIACGHPSRRPLRGALADAFAKRGDDFSLLVAREDVHGGPKAAIDKEILADFGEAEDEAATKIIDSTQ
jgi:hypothetical protein